MERWGRFVLIAAAALAFSPAVISSFHFDDYSLFADPPVTSTSGWWEVFRLDRTRSLTYLTFWLNYQIGGEGPLGYHLVNLAVHLAAVWLAWGVFQRLAAPAAGIVAAGIFALHPLQAEPVAYVFARATLLSALFCLLCWRDWLERRFGRSIAWFTLAMFAKEEAAAFPLFLIGIEFLINRREFSLREPGLKAAAAMLAVVGVFAVRVMYAATVTPSPGIGLKLGDITPFTYLLTQGRVVWNYFGLIIWPAGLNFDRDTTLSTGFDPLTIAAWTALLAAFAGIVWYSHKRAEVYWLLGGLILLFPTSTVIPLADLMAERRMYLPLASFSLAVGILLARTPKWLPMVLAGTLAIVSFQRASIWETEETLWRDTVRKSPQKLRPKLQLARALGAKSPPVHDEQFKLLELARDLAPNDPLVATERGVFFLQTGIPAAALEEFDRTVALNPGDAQAQANRGVALHALGRTQQATDSFWKALELDPCNFDARHNLLLTRHQVPGSSSATLSVDHESCQFTPAQVRQLHAASP